MPESRVEMFSQSESPTFIFANKILAWCCGHYAGEVRTAEPSSLTFSLTSIALTMWLCNMRRCIPKHKVLISNPHQSLCQCGCGQQGQSAGPSMVPVCLLCTLCRGVAWEMLIPFCVHCLWLCHLLQFDSWSMFQRQKKQRFKTLRTLKAKFIRKINLAKWML